MNIVSNLTLKPNKSSLCLTFCKCHHKPSLQTHIVMFQYFNLKKFTFNHHIEWNESAKMMFYHENHDCNIKFFEFQNSYLDWFYNHFIQQSWMQYRLYYTVQHLWPHEVIEGSVTLSALKLSVTSRSCVKVDGMKGLSRTVQSWACLSIPPFSYSCEGLKQIKTKKIIENKDGTLF